MKSLKMKILIFASLIFMLILNLNLISYATDASSNPKYIGITELKTESEIGYAIGNPNNQGAKIWNLIEYQNATSNTYSENNLYCLKAGVGFENVDKRATYDVFYDMKQEKEDIAKENEILKNLVEGTIELENGTTISQYSAILAILDMFYYDGVSNESYKENLLNAAGIHSSSYQYSLTNDDIEAVQQAALWYFTNYGENDSIYDKTGNSGWLYYTENAITYTTLSDLNRPEGQQRQLQAEILYKYLINAAKEKASEYDNIASNTTAPVQLDTQKLNYEIQGSRTIIGPIHITKNNIKSYNLEFITKIGNSETSDYILLDQNKSQVLEGTTVEDLIGEDFYVSLPAESTLEKTISIEVNIEYDETNFTLWASNTNADEQPVVIPKKEEISKPGKLEIEIPNLMGEYNLEILKVDQENGEEPLEGAEFKITLADGTEKTGRTNAEGKIEIEGVEIKEEGIETIKIEETKAPEGYNKIFNSVELEVTKEIQNGEYVVSDIELKNAEGTGLIEGEVKANLENGKITVTVPNKKVEGSYELEIVKEDKDRGTKLSGAVFNVNGEDKEATNASGIINLGTVQITDTTIPDTFTIRETTAPEGYNKFEGSIELSVAKTIQNGVYVVDPENTIMTVRDSGGTEITQNVPVTIDKTTGKITITVDNGKITGGYNLEILKVDQEDEGKVLEGAEFKVTLADGTEKTERTNAEGKIEIEEIEIKEEGIETIKIEETKAPEGYNKIFNSVELEVTKEIQNGEYVVSDIELKNAEGTGLIEGEVKANLENGKITVTVPNKKVEGSYELEIVKEDKDRGTKLSGAVFNVNGEDKEATNASGIINLGTVQITDTTIPDTFTIRETTAPEGYNKFEGSIELSVAKTIQNGVYVVDPENTIMTVRDSGGTEITQNVPVTIDKTTGKITITVDNGKITGGYNLEILKVDQEDEGKVLEGAEFKVTLADGTEKTERTNAEGKIEIEGVEIKEEGTETIKIEETKAPEGYNKIFNSVELEVTKEIQNGEYVVSKIELKNAEGTGLIEGELKANLENGKITVTVPNKKVEGSYELEIVKEDKDRGMKLSGAVFNVNGEDKTATNSNGIVNIGTFQITDTSTPDTFTIRETTAPEGYNKFEGSIELSVAKTIQDGVYVVDTENTTMVVKDSEGTEIIENIPVTIDKTTGKITITVDNEKTEGSYELEIVKQDGETGSKLSGAVFNVNGEDKEATNSDGIVNIGTFQITDTSTPDRYTIKEISAPEGYNEFEGSIELSVAKTIQDGVYVVDTENTTMVVKDSTGATITENIPVTIDKTTGKITITVDNEKTEGNYVVEIVKQDGETGEKLSGAVFNVNGEDKTATNVSGIVNLGTIQITDITEPDTYTIKETTAPEGYNKFEGTIELSVAKKLENGNYIVDTENTTMTVRDSDGAEITQNVPVTIDKTTGKITITVDNEKTEGNYVVEIVKQDGETGEKLSGAVFNVNGEDKTATNVSGIVNLGTIQITDITEPDTYTIRETTAPEGYNKFEGTIELSVAKKLENGNYIVDTENTTMTVRDSDGAEITQNVPVTIDKTTGKITITVENVKKEFDLALRKFIAAVSRDENIEEDEYLRNEDGSYSRAPVVDASKLNTIGEDGNKATTAIYNHTKEPVEVRKGDTVIYTIRVYNEGEISGYAQTITDYLPEELEFLPNHPINQQYEWTIEGNRVTTDYLSKEKETEERQNLIEAFDETLYHKEVQIACKVKDTAKRDWKITNLAQITEDADKNGDEADDRDSTPDGGFEEPEGEDRPTYKDDEIENGDEYIPGQEDDDDFEKVIIKEFDLALRKFIIAVSNDQTIEEDEYLRNEDGSYTRAPVVDTSLLNTEDEEGNLITTSIYNHTKEPVLVQKNDIVIYMLRVYNEGDIDGYAAEIKDHLPPYLEYVEGEFNDQYGWEVSEDGRTLTTRYLENSLINKPAVNEEGEYELSYQEVPVMCRVIESAPTNENITNIADITEYQDDEKEEAIDRDSESDNVELPNDEDLPGYKGDETGEYIPGQQDDDDFEKVIVKEFDLALRKWVTEAIVIENGKETVTATGHQPYDDPEEIIKVELHRKNINDVVVKFRYKIRVTNEGDIPGYVKEITDYVPEGLRFDPADNPGWVDEGNNVISTTLTEDILLQPGEYTEVEVVLTWINDENNMGVMTNIAEISEDDNEYDIPDRDSTPDNQEEGEDDIDDAPVMISISTGATRTYFMLGGIVLITIAGGIILIKKFVI